MITYQKLPLVSLLFLSKLGIKIEHTDQQTISKSLSKNSYFLKIF